MVLELIQQRFRDTVVSWLHSVTVPRRSLARCQREDFHLKDGKLPVSLVTAFVSPAMATASISKS